MERKDRGFDEGLGGRWRTGTEVGQRSYESEKESSQSPYSLYQKCVFWALISAPGAKKRAVSLSPKMIGKPSSTICYLSTRLCPVPYALWVPDIA
eukprot:2185799-Rhodomonas_salina.2